MKAYLRISLTAVALVLLSACASTQKTAYGDAPTRQVETVVQDHLYVAAVEKMARQRGTRVVWVNPPKKKVVETVAVSH